jgi:hypothetical protein
MGTKISLEIQYFKGCPNSNELIERVKVAIQEFDSKINYFETLVEDNLTAQKVRFRGSPTLLIDGQDFENLEESKNPNLSCRFYHNGLPTIEEIKNSIQTKLHEDQT